MESCSYIKRSLEGTKGASITTVKLGKPVVDNNIDLIDERWWKRWASIYVAKGHKEGWNEAKEWVRRTFDEPTTNKLALYIKKAMGVRN